MFGTSSVPQPLAYSTKHQPGSWGSHHEPALQEQLAKFISLCFYGLNRNYSHSPLCACGLEEQTTIHLLTNCYYTEETVRDNAIFQLNLGNDNLNLDELGTVAALNCSRDPSFVQLCKEVVENDNLNLRTSISLSSTDTWLLYLHLFDMVKLYGPLKAYTQHCTRPHPGL